MQTFLPYPNFTKSAEVLDPNRLGNQFYNEGLTLLRGHWQKHACARMWKGYEYALGKYLLACSVELANRGSYYRDHVVEIRGHMFCTDHEAMPPWLGDERVHSSHRAALLYKDYDWYSRFGWTEEPKMDYFWPV